MQSGRPQRVYLRFSPRSVPFPLIVLAAATGVCSGYYLFDGLVRDAVAKAVLEREQQQSQHQQPAAPASHSSSAK
jgi:hypothetical protein